MKALIYTRRAAFSLFLALSIIGLVGQAAFAQSTTVSTGVTTAMPMRCMPIDFNLRFGASDAGTGGAVTALQNYLAGEGYFDSAYIGSGRFGPMTLGAVVRFQVAQSLPATGYVGPMTRNIILKRCGIVVPPEQKISISALYPNRGSVGTTVTIFGNGFTSSNTILMDGSVVASDVRPNPAMMRPCYIGTDCNTQASVSFTIPEALSPNCPPGMFCAMYMRQVTPGTYKISVQNSNGSSNTLAFEVTSKEGSGNISISGLDAPASLTIGQSGAWTVRVNAGANAGTLHYSVVWGDENMAANAIMAPRPTDIQTSATFTHTYQVSGVYNPVFTVTDEAGHTATVSASVKVNPIY